MSEVQQRIAEIKSRLSKATPGEWSRGSGSGCVVSDKKDGGLVNGAADEDGVRYYGGYLIGESMGSANAEFIAHAKADIEFLLTIAGVS